MKAMVQGLRKMVMVSLALCLIAALCLAPGQAWAKDATPTTVKVKIILTGQPPKLVRVGDEEAHIVGLGQLSGTATFSDGRTGQYNNVYFLDSLRGRYGKVWGYSKMTFKDGSRFFIKWKSAVAGRDKAGKAILKGTGEFIKGTGSYQGIKGSMTFTNRRIAPSKKFPKGAGESEAVFTYTLPAK